jgi:glycosyltransferase involved in cell wall biosynthesis
LKKKQILFLWAPLADYSVACLRQLSLQTGIELSIIYQPGDPNVPYQEFDLTFFKTRFLYTKENESTLKDFCERLMPDVIMMSSWNYKFYMSISRQARRMGSFVISTFDGQWAATIRQWIGILTAPLFLKPSIDKFFVPGDRQYTFASKLGYKNSMQGYYCANSSLFNSDIKFGSKNFIFVGRLVSSKGIDILIEAYRKYRHTAKAPWGLIICGEGKMQNLLICEEGIQYVGFLQPHGLSEIFKQARCLILSSYFEPWGVIIHEAALSGLAIITTNKVGAATFFVRDGQNGFIVNPDSLALYYAMKLLSAADDAKLEKMSAVSKTLGLLWTTEKWSDYVYENILEIINTKNTK